MRAVAAGFAECALVVATQQPASIRSAERTSQLIQSIRELPCRLVISLFEEDSAAEGQRAGLIEIIDQTHLRTVGVVPRDRTLFLRQEKGELPEERSRAGCAFANIAARLCGEDVRLFNRIRKIRTRRVL
jgi:septum formation inhibitor-activating ATPase MinD